MLLHDSGRSENTARHAEASAVNAVRVARRMKITGNDLSTLVFLVDHHLTMSEIARRKNLDNEETIIEFARVVETQDRLDLLMLITFADTQGTGAARSYSDWKDLLLWQLYHRTTQALSGVEEFIEGVEQTRREIQQRLLKNLDRKFDPGEVAAHLENLPPAYFDTTSEDLIREHISLVHNFLNYQISHDDGSLRPVILKADIFTREDNIAIQTFYVATDKLEAVTDDRDRAKFEKVLNQAMGMEPFDFNQSLTKKQKYRNAPVYDVSEMETQISIDQATSRQHTLLDVQTADYPGLLYRIASAIADCETSIVSARVTTEKGAALDTFYLCDRNGKKIESEEQLRRLTQEVRSRIAP